VGRHRANAVKVYEGEGEEASQSKPTKKGSKEYQYMTKQFLLASDFDQTLSFNDSGVVLSELIGFHGFHDKVKGLAEMNLVQQGAELSYLILHDPDFRKVRREHLVETGKQIRLKHDVALFARALDNLAEGYKFHFNVISAAPQEIIQSALEGIVPPDHIFGTRFRYNEATGEVDSIIRAAAGWGKITVLEELRANLGISHDHIIYMGDGSSDLPVMMHVNQYDGLTIAVSEAKFITRVAKRTVVSDNAMSVLVPVLEKVLRWDSARIRRLFASYGLTLLEWDKMRTDRLTIQESDSTEHVSVAAAPQLNTQ
jgi:phosphoserine phosphatase